MRVAVLKGGSSLERTVSLRSGARVEAALQRLGHDVLGLDVGADFVDRLVSQRPPAAVVALHGRGGGGGGGGGAAPGPRRAGTGAPAGGRPPPRGTGGGQAAA